MSECYSSSFHVRAFSFIKNEKPVAMGSSTDLHLLLSPVNHHLLTYNNDVNTV